jgi:hypothetical protein
VDIPLEEEVNKHEEDFNDFKKEDLGIQVLEEEVADIPPEGAEDNNHSLLEEEETVTITVTRGISSVISAINLGTITLNVKGKLNERYVSMPTMQRRMPTAEEQLHYLSNKNLTRIKRIFGILILEPAITRVANEIYLVI